MSLYDRLVPAEALRWGTLTRSWDPWADVGPWYVMPLNPIEPTRHEGDDR